MPVRDALALQVAFKEDLRRGGILEALMDTFEKTQRGIEVPGNPFDALPNRQGRFGKVKDGGVPYRELGLGEYFRWVMASRWRSTSTG